MLGVFARAIDERRIEIDLHTQPGARWEAHRRRRDARRRADAQLSRGRRVPVAVQRDRVPVLRPARRARLHDARAIRASAPACSRSWSALGFVGRGAQRDHRTARRPAQVAGGAARTRPSPATSWCTAPTRSGPSVHRLVPPGLDEVDVPELRAARRSSTGSTTRSGSPRPIPAAFAREALARAGSHTLWYVSVARLHHARRSCARRSPTIFAARARRASSARCPTTRSSRSPRCRCSRPPDRRAESRAVRAVVRLTTTSACGARARTCSRACIVVGALVTIRHIVATRSASPLPIQTHMGLLGVGRGVVPRHRAARLRRRRVGRAALLPAVPAARPRRCRGCPGVSAGLRRGVRRERRPRSRSGSLLYELVLQERDDPRPRAPRGVARLSRAAGVRARHGLRGSDVHDLRRARAARAARAALVARGGLRLPGRADPPGRCAARGARRWSRVGSARDATGAIRGARGAVAGPASAPSRTSCGPRTARTTSGIRCARSRTRRRRGTGSIPCARSRTTCTSSFAGDHVSAGIHAVSALVFVALLVVIAGAAGRSRSRSTPAVALVVALSSRNLDSLERYGLATLPFVLAGADVIAEPGPRACRARASPAPGLVAASMLAFTGVLVP